MALIKCPECGKLVSDQAPACVQCGFPITQQNSEETDRCPVCGKKLETGTCSCGYDRSLDLLRYRTLALAETLPAFFMKTAPSEPSAPAEPAAPSGADTEGKGGAGPSGRTAGTAGRTEGRTDSRAQKPAGTRPEDQAERREEKPAGTRTEDRNAGSGAGGTAQSGTKSAYESIPGRPPQYTYSYGAVSPSEEEYGSEKKRRKTTPLEKSALICFCLFWFGAYIMGIQAVRPELRQYISEDTYITWMVIMTALPVLISFIAPNREPDKGAPVISAVILVLTGLIAGVMVFGTLSISQGQSWSDWTYTGFVITAVDLSVMFVRMLRDVIRR